MGAILTNITEIFANSGWAQIFLVQDGWKYAVMLAVACVLLYLAIVKQFEPLLLLPIGFGMLMTNLPLDGIFHIEIFLNETNHINWEMLGNSGGLADYIYLGVKLGIYPPLIFLGIGTMTDFTPLIARPSSLLLGAAAQLGIFFTFIGARLLGFTGPEAASIGIIGGADGPTAIYTTTRLAPHLLGSIAVAAYCYMALVPVIQPPIMRFLTTEKERQVIMDTPRQVSRTEKILFPIVVTIIVSLTLPDAAILVGCLMMGNLMKESGVVERITKTAGNELMNIITIFLGFSVGCTTNASTFLTMQTVEIIVLGVVAFGVGTAGGVLLGKVMCALTHGKINPLIGSAGVSAVPMAARVSQKVGQEYNPRNYLLMHAMGPNVAGVIGSAVAAGILINIFG
ncbi:sodium ion-translocating decarboxylase subunit beta [uncultured Subdoligranulum sp.]|uniref:sodium ion-translocating decarboxylase subunit beta n=1 Tax=uncultured Subdoligranulum sp. TaxID=512298 RepID=UPI00262259AA|nr:sodium ion-translocating decarboxylase subunit beta [uncultured Subdoligranulum sp.]